MTSTRTDIHRPTTLVTEDYEYEGYYYLGTSDYRVPGYFNASCEGVHSTGHLTTYWGGNYGDAQGRCDHCGAHILYGAVLYHRPTDRHIHVGEICLGNRFERATADFQTARKNAQLDREAQRVLTAWNEYKASHVADWDALYASENGFVKNVLAKGRQYGNLSDKQLAGIQGALVRDADYAAKKAAEALNPKVTTQCPEGKGIVIEGTVISTREDSNDWGYVLKLLVEVETPAGSYRVWGNAPAGLLDAGHWNESGWVDGRVVGRDDKVRFIANVTRSDKDEAFGFFSRPRKAEFVKVVA